jgi:hypothetical protein
LPLSTFVAAKLVPDVVSPTPTADPKPSDDAHKAGEAQLTIEIATKSMEDTLAVFADHKILFRFSLAGAYGDDAIPIRRVFTLPSGPHEFSVGLYKDDKTLRSNKEGLGELRAGENNVLAIHVAKHSKFLLGPGQAMPSMPNRSVRHVLRQRRWQEKSPLKRSCQTNPIVEVYKVNLIPGSVLPARVSCQV